MFRPKVLSLTVGLFLIFSCAFAAELQVKSDIVKVCIYPDSALITRSANLKLEPGSYKVIFSDIIPDVDENSLKVFGQGSAQAKLFGAVVKKEFLKEVPSEKIKALKEEIQKLDDQVKALDNQKSLLLEEKAFLDSVRLFSQGQIPKDLVTKIPTGKDLEDTLNFLDVKLKDNYSQVMDCEVKERDLLSKIGALKNELAQISGSGKKLKRSIIADLEAVNSGSFDLSISYLVRAVSWQPIYDARASFDLGQVELTSYGLVKQNTGEDWTEVEAALSTAKPTLAGRMPEVEPWFLRPYQPRPMRQAFKDKADYMFSAGAPALESKMAESSVDEELEEPKEQAMEVEYSQAKETGVAMLYKLTRKANVLADGSEYKLPVSTQTLKADFEYMAYPRSSPFAYLSSRVDNSKDLQLPGGRVNVFLDGDFVSSSSVDNIAPGEEFDLNLGVDENVKIKRECLEKKVDETLIVNIPSANKRTINKFKITVENYKGKKIKVKLFEAMPVSEDERIKVKIDKVSLEPKEKDYKDKKGVWLWELELAPKEKKEIFYTFTLEHPRQMRIEGL